MRGLQEIELALKVEIKKSSHGIVRADDAGRHLGLLRLFLKFHPVLIAAALATADRNGKSGTLGWILHGGLHHRVGKLLGGERLHFLAIFLAELNRKTYALKIYPQSFIRIVAELDVYRENAARVRRLLGKFILVLVGIHPGERGDGESFVRFQGSCFDRALRERARKAGRERGCNRDEKHEQKREGRDAHPVIISLSHLDAFDSWGTFRVALRS